jgi:hypothetical protein
MAYSDLFNISESHGSGKRVRIALVDGVEKLFKEIPNSILLKKNLLILQTAIWNNPQNQWVS